MRQDLCRHQAMMDIKGNILSGKLLRVINLINPHPLRLDKSSALDTRAGQALQLIVVVVVVTPFRGSDRIIMML